MEVFILDIWVIFNIISGFLFYAGDVQEGILIGVRGEVILVFFYFINKEEEGLEVICLVTGDMELSYLNQLLKRFAFFP